jgi:hypothetical protein
VDLDVFEGGVVWLSQQEGKLMKGSKFGDLDDTKTIQAGLHMPKAVSVYHVYRYDIAGQYILLPQRKRKLLFSFVLVIFFSTQS